MAIAILVTMNALKIGWKVRVGGMQGGWYGLVEYITADGWVGVREVRGDNEKRGLDEVRIESVVRV